MITVPVALDSSPYDVVVGAGALGHLASVVPSRAQRAAVVTQAAIALDVDPGIPFDVHQVPDGEQAKSLAVVEGLCRRFAAAGLSRHDVVVAVGGGVVSDVAGLAAALYHRGVAYVTVATSLLAQVDAAIGGKTAVNLPEGKNLVGAFWQPTAVLCDTDVLRTLPEREWSSGRGEMAKYAFLDPRAAAIAQLPLDEQVARCVEVKVDVVVADERESGRRALLNYGHTLAHALEATGFAADGGPGLRHGEAVAVGLAFAARLARRLGRIGDDRVDDHLRVLESLGLGAELPPGLAAAELVGYMRRDKKAEHDLRFVLDGPAGVEVVHGVSPDDVVATLCEMGAHR